MISFVFRVITFAGSAAIFGFLTREYLRRKAEIEKDTPHKNLPVVADKRHSVHETVDAEIVTDDE